MRQALSSLQKAKTVIHVVQALLIFIVACVTIAVFTGPGKSDGRLKWFFTMCFLTVPALIYLTAVPMWTRAMNVAKSLWFAIVDVLFTIFWLSAFAAVLAWLRRGTIDGAQERKIDISNANCSTFSGGVTEKQCKLAYTASSFGIIIFLLFVATSTISILYTIKSRKNPNDNDPWLAPEGSSQSYNPTPGGLERGSSPSKDPIWDTNTQELDGMHEEHDSDRDSYEQAHNQHANSHIGRRASEEDDYALLNKNHTETDEGVHPGRQWGPLSSHPGGAGHVSMPPLPHVDTDTEYRGSSPQKYQAPSAMSPSSYHVDSPAGLNGRPNHVPEYEEYKGGAGGRYTFSGRP